MRRDAGAGRSILPDGRRRRPSRRRARPAAAVAAAAALCAAVPAAAQEPEPLRPGIAPDVPRFVADALGLYRAPPDSAEAAERLARWREEGGPASPGDSLAAAGLWRRAGVTEAALAALPRGTDGTATAARVAVERARILFGAAGRARDTTEARRLTARGEAAFEAACAGLDDPARDALWLDLRGLATPDEQRAWLGLGPHAEACAWLRAFLTERAWRASLSIGERLALHYARLREARSRWWLRTPRLTRDMADRLGRPPGLELDDRGLVFLRMGEPEREVDVFHPRLELNESWAYRRPGGPRIYHFAPVSRTGLRALADFRMLETLAYATGTTMTSELMAAGGSRLSGLYRSRAPLDEGFGEDAFDYLWWDRRLRARGDANNPGFLGMLFEERERTLADGRYVVQRVPDVPDVRPVVAMVHEALRFAAADGEGAEVWFLAAGRAGDLTAARAPPSEADGAASAAEAGEASPRAALRYQLRAEVAMPGPDGYRRLRAESRPRLADPLRASDGLPVRIRTRLPPGRWPYTLTLRDAGAADLRTGAWARDTLTVASPLPGLPSLSDLAVAADSGGDWTRDGAVRLGVLPTHVTGPDGIAHVWFEVYGLSAGDPYTVDVRVVADPRGDAAERRGPDALPAGREPGSEAFALRFPSEVPLEAPAFGRHHLRIDLSDDPPGAYELTVRVTDRRTGVRSLPAVTDLHRTR